MGAHRRDTRLARFRNWVTRSSRLADLSVPAPNEEAGRDCMACGGGRADLICTCPGDCGGPVCAWGWQ
jgi:hypothetical protein